MTQSLSSDEVSRQNIDSLWQKYLIVAGGSAPEWVCDRDIGCGFSVVQVPGSTLPHILILDESLLPKQASQFLAAFWLQYGALLAEEAE